MCGTTPQAASATGSSLNSVQEQQNNIEDGDNSLAAVDGQHEELHLDDGNRGRHRGRQRHGISAGAAIAGPLDLPTWAASPFGQWQSRDLVNRTPQYLTTLKAPPPVSLPSSAWSAPPLFLHDEFLVMGTTDGCVCLWPAEVLAGGVARRGSGMASSGDPDGSGEATVNPDSLEHHDALLPGVVVDTATGPRANRRSAIVQLAAAPLGTQLVPDVDASRSSKDSSEEARSTTTPTTPNDAGAADVGTVGDDASLAVPALYQVVAMTVLGDVHVISISATGAASLAFSWNTARCGITCATVYDNGTIILGYQSGCLEAWNIESSANNGRIVANLIWRGSFSSHSPIRSVAPMAKAKGPPNDDPGKSASQDYLLVIIQPETRRSSASLIEVLNIASIEKAWEARDEAAAAGEVPLEEHWVLPEAGMEIIDASSLPVADTTEGAAGAFSRRTAAQWIPSSGADCLCPLPKSADGSASVAVGLSDGTMAILSAPTASLDDSRSWGVAKAADQVLFQYPCVGLGHVRTLRNNGDNKTYPHVACCLRGATTYLIPLNSDEDAPENPPITVISYPNDIDADMGIQHLQGFTAGNLRLTDQSSPVERHTIPVLFYAWPGGIVDVYCCELLKPPKGTERYRPTLIELIQNGSAQLLKSFLSTCQEDVWRDRPDWSAARSEIVVGAEMEDINSSRAMTIEELCSSELSSFRGLLLQLADTEETKELLS
jgi:hypothetical protein